MTLRGYLLNTGLAATAALLAYGGGVQAAPITLVADGVSYTLTEDAISGSPLTDQFTLTISGINGPADVAGNDHGGRSGLNAVAFDKPTNFVSAVMIAPATGFTTMNGGLNAGGCNGNSNSQFCFENGTVPNTPALPANTTLTFVFDETISSGDFSGYVQSLIKTDWAGSKVGNYDNVSLDVAITDGPVINLLATVPEPASLAVLGVGLLGLGFVASRKRKA